MRMMTNFAGVAGAKLTRQLSRPLSMSILPACALLGSCAIGLVSCATHERFAAPPRVLEVYSERRIATLHFPRGSYVLSSEDRRGYYYRAPGGVIEHTAAGRVRRDGGIFVSNRDRNHLRGYVKMSYGLTHVGNFSRIEHQFREPLAPAEGPELPAP
ncbi:MAG: hypothetical protein ABR514_02230 [Chthoniobacterales bacterium]